MSRPFELQRADVVLPRKLGRHDPNLFVHQAQEPAASTGGVSGR